MPRPRKDARAAREHKLRTMVINYFSNGFNKKQAMLSVGYALSSAETRAADVFNAPFVQSEIERILKERLNDTRGQYAITKERVLQEYAMIAFGGLDKFVNIEGDTLEWDFTKATAEDLKLISALKLTQVFGKNKKGKKNVKGMKIDFKMYSKLDALNAIARHLGMFNDKLTLEGELTAVDKLLAGRQRALQQNQEGEEPTSADEESEV